MKTAPRRSFLGAVTATGAHVGVPGDGLDDVRRDAQLHQQRDDGVPQVVQPDLGAAGFLSEAGEVQGEITST
ncbi:hypothetical protein ABZ328_18570 [Micromonospora aurantiaca]|uniref:hypothetical protein n=1 Tax=Micromonospora aurantiaca (nom. illeg.) TaxID=47850 RepID=UPI00340B35D5